MSDYTKEQMINAVDSFPDSLRDMLFSADTERKVQKIGMEVGLLIAQIKVLSDLTNDAILGLLVGRAIEAEIQNSLGITESQAKGIAEKLSIEILNTANELKVKALDEQRAKEEKERSEKETEERWTAEEKELEEVTAKETAELSSKQNEPSETPIEIKTPTQVLLLGKAPVLTPENLPIEKEVESFLPKLIPKVAIPDSEPVHPFEEKMKMAFTSDHNFLNGEIRDGSATEATPAEVAGIAPTPLEVPSPFTQTSPPSIPPAPTPTTGGLRHDPYREAIE